MKETIPYRVAMGLSRRGSRPIITFCNYSFTAYPCQVILGFLAMSKERRYLVKTESGEEIGPLDQDALIHLTQIGTITVEARIRSVLVPSWEKAVDLPFLKPLLLEQQAKRVMDEKVSWWTHIKNRALFRAEDAVVIGSLVKVRAESFERASIISRILAAIIDLLIVILGCALFTGACYLGLKRGVLNADNCAYLLLCLCWCWFIFYYVYMIGVKTQTVGQRFWGIFLIRTNAMKFYVGRAFFYMIFMIPFGLLTPLHVWLMPSKRSWQELLTGTRMVRLKLADSSKIR